MLLCFETVLGLKFNIGKLAVIPVGVVHIVGHKAYILGCRVESLLTTFLGVLTDFFKEIHL